ncbi:MAG: hypothetical protein NVSMB29_18280 [Candidatus Dormibacteria bacterium]
MPAREDPAPPVPIIARLRYDDDQVRRLQSASSRAAKRTALKAVHDELAARLAPQLEQLRAAGLVIDHATSWLLAEVVVHAPAARAAETLTAMSGIPELNDVRRGSLRSPRRR